MRNIYYIVAVILIITLQIIKSITVFESLTLQALLYICLSIYEIRNRL